MKTVSVDLKCDIGNYDPSNYKLASFEPSDYILEVCIERREVLPEQAETKLIKTYPATIMRIPESTFLKPSFMDGYFKDTLYYMNTHHHCNLEVSRIDELASRLAAYFSGNAYMPNFASGFHMVADVTVFCELEAGDAEPGDGPVIVNDVEVLREAMIPEQWQTRGV